MDLSNAGTVENLTLEIDQTHFVFWNECEPLGLLVGSCELDRKYLSGLMIVNRLGPWLVALLGAGGSFLGGAQWKEIRSLEAWP